MPPVDENEKRDKQIKGYVSKKGKQNAITNAANEGKSLSDFIKDRTTFEPAQTNKEPQMNTQTPPDQQNQYLIEQARIAADAGDFVLSMSFRKKIIYPVDTLLYAKATQGAAWVRAYMNTAPAEEVYGANWLEEVSAAEAGLFGSYTVVNLKEGPA